MSPERTPVPRTPVSGGLVATRDSMTLADVFDPDPPRDVTVFDIDLPPGLAFIRSLGRAGVPVVACSSRPGAAGRLSRHATVWRRCPPVQECERFTDWLTDQN